MELTTFKSFQKIARRPLCATERHRQQHSHDRSVRRHRLRARQPTTFDAPHLESGPSRIPQAPKTFQRRRLPHQRTGGQTQLLQQAVASQLTEMLTQQGLCSTDTDARTEIAGNAIRVSSNANAMTLGSQLASVIHASIPQPHLGQHAPQGGRT